MMISDGETKGSSAQSDKSHSFPLLDSRAFDEEKGTSKCGGDHFKPLFNTDRIDDGISPPQGLGGACPGDSRNSEDQVRRKGFKRGFNAGKQDACSLVQQEMAPQIKSFADAFNRWNEIMIRNEENSSLQILKMAVSIAEKILGDAPECSNGRPDSLKSELKELMRKAYRMEFKLNPEDMDALSGFMSCEHVNWDRWDYVSAAGDAEVPRGSLLVHPCSRTISADDAILPTLDASLAQGLAQK